MLFALTASLRRLRQRHLLKSKYLLAGRCILCAGPAQPALDLCAPCAGSLPVLGRHCRYCALPLVSHCKLVCGECLRKPPAFSRTEACWYYKFPVAQLVSAFKYDRKYSYGQTLAQLMAQQLAAAYTAQPLPDFIVAAPLHWRRHWHRGFNQSELLARHYSSALNIRLFHGLQRQRSTRSQQSLTAAQRKQNLRNAFHVNQQKPIAGKCLALVDDVMTTGATAREISQVLINAGAAEVHIWVLARTPH